MMRVVGECFFWYRLTRVFPDKFHRAVKRLCVCVCVCVSKVNDFSRSQAVMYTAKVIISRKWC